MKGITMKLSLTLCSSVVALAALTLTANGAFATGYTTTKSNVKTNAEPKAGSDAPQQPQSATALSSMECVLPKLVQRAVTGRHQTRTPATTAKAMSQQK
jgi:hypothetical protein